MTFYQSLAVVLLRVWAAVLLISGVSYLVSVIGMALDPSITFGSGPDAGRMRIFELVQFVAYYGIGLPLWLFARPIGKHIAAGCAAPAPNLAVSSEGLVTIGSFLIGLFYIVKYGPQGVVGLAAAFIDIAKQSDAERLGGGYVTYFPGWQQLAGYWLAIFIGLVIALRARDFGKLFAWLRQAGQYREKSEPSGEAGKSAAGE